MTWNRLYVALTNSWRRRPATTKRRLRRRLDSWESRGSAFVAAPPLSKYSKLFIPRRPFLSSTTLFVPSHFIEAGGGEDCSQSHWANSGERSLPSLLCSQENLPFLFFHFSSKLSSWANSLMSESWINCFKPRGRATHHQTLPEMFYRRLLKISRYTRCTNIARQKESDLIFCLLIMVLNNFREKNLRCFRIMSEGYLCFVFSPRETQTVRRHNNILICSSQQTTDQVPLHTAASHFILWNNVSPVVVILNLTDWS